MSIPILTYDALEVPTFDCNKVQEHHHLEPATLKKSTPLRNKYTVQYTNRAYAHTNQYETHCKSAMPITNTEICDINRRTQNDKEWTKGVEFSRHHVCRRSATVRTFCRHGDRWSRYCTYIGQNILIRSAGYGNCIDEWKNGIQMENFCNILETFRFVLQLP